MLATPAGYTARRLGDADEPALQALLASDPAFWILTEGAPPRSDEARELFAELPPGVPPVRKHVVGVLAADRLVGVLDFVEGYPDATTWFLGLVFLAPEHRGGGLGRALLEALAAYVRAAGGTRLRLAVVVDHAAARRLYDRLGYAFVARRTRTSFAGVPIEVDVLERALDG